MDQRTKGPEQLKSHDLETPPQTTGNVTHSSPHMAKEESAMTTEEMFYHRFWESSRKPIGYSPKVQTGYMPLHIVGEHTFLRPWDKSDLGPIDYNVGHWDRLPPPSMTPRQGGSSPGFKPEDPDRLSLAHEKSVDDIFLVNSKKSQAHKVKTVKGNHREKSGKKQRPHERR